MLSTDIERYIFQLNIEKLNFNFMNLHKPISLILIGLVERSKITYLNRQSRSMFDLKLQNKILSQWWQILLRQTAKEEQYSIEDLLLCLSKSSQLEDLSKEKKKCCYKLFKCFMFHLHFHSRKLNLHIWEKGKYWIMYW